MRFVALRYLVVISAFPSRAALHLIYDMIRILHVSDGLCYKPWLAAMILRLKLKILTGNTPTTRTLTITSVEQIPRELRIRISISDIGDARSGIVLRIRFASTPIRHL